jgi:hypothetical protein
MSRTHKFFYLPLILLLLFGFYFSGCSDSPTGIRIEKFNPITNAEFSGNDTLVSLNADLTDAVLNGIEIPTFRQTVNGNFIFNFSVKNFSSQQENFFYKVFYRNISYAYQDTNILSGENFYGSWINTAIGFKVLPPLQKGVSIELNDSFKIVGNPRNEKIYFGSDPQKSLFSEDSVGKKMNAIRHTPEWMKQIEEKSKKEKRAVEDQIFLDAVWALNDERNKDTGTNNRWKRNPRMGNYEFMLVVTTEADLKKMPEDVKNLELKDTITGRFRSPFGYFLSNEAKKLKNTTVMISPKKLNVKATFDLGAGIFVDRFNVNKSYISKDFYSMTCGDYKGLYKEAQFEQYFHTINKNFILRNVPVMKDVVGENMTRSEYENLMRQYKDKLLEMYVKSTDAPCETVTSDSGKIFIHNPGCENGIMKKEHVGVKSRIGFTYGKCRAKIKFPPLLSSDHVWNGITNAFWLIFQSDANWNKRRICDAAVGYIPKSEQDNPEALKHSLPTTNYSEIDFEIMKESQYWPKTSYPLGGKVRYQTDDAYNNNEIMVTCTNWDMACHEPVNFGVGAKEFNYQDKKYAWHRWNDFYKALTTKIAKDHDDLFKAPYYYFEIDWEPDKLIWRIGPEADKLKVIAVMTSEISAIPNNQMVMVVTQEFHNKEWLPTAPFNQNFVPFPKNDIQGEILEVVVE